MISGQYPSITFLSVDRISLSVVKSTTAASCPAFFVAAATHAKPRGKVSMYIFSVLAEIRRALMVLNLIKLLETHFI
jgi:hypothetical protein